MQNADRDKMYWDESPEWRRRSSRIKALEEKRERERRALAESRKRRASANKEIRESSNRNKGKNEASYVDESGDYWDLFYEEYDHLYDSGTRKRTRKSMPVEYLISKTKPIQGGQNMERSNSGEKLSFLPEQHVLKCFLDILQSEDPGKVFSRPVDPDKVKGYYDIVKEPMDLGTMRDKLEKGMYKSMEQFERDVTLMCNNAIFFNASDTVYHRVAKDIMERARKIFEGLRNDPQNFIKEVTEGCKKRSADRNPKAQAGTPMSAKLPPKPRGGKDKLQRRYTYRPSNGKDKDCLFSKVLNASKQFFQLKEPNDKNYKESMVQFVNGLNGRVQSIASKKLESFHLRDLMIAANPNLEPQNLHFPENEITPLQRISQPEKTPHKDPPMFSSPSPLLFNSAWRFPSSSFVREAARNVSGINEAQFLPPAPVLSNKTLSIPGADVVACQGRNMTAIDEAQFIPPTPMLSKKALSIPGAEVDACQARNVTAINESLFLPPTPFLSNKAVSIAGADAIASQARNVTPINGGNKLNDRGKSKMLYENKSWDACAAAMLGNIFFKHDKYGSTSGTQGETSKNASTRGSLPDGVVNNDNAIGIIEGNDPKEKSNCSSFAAVEGKNAQDCQIVFSTNGLTGNYNGQRGMLAEVIEPSSYVADMPQRAGRTLTQVWPTRVISGPQPKPSEGITANTLTGAFSLPMPRTMPLEDLNSSMKTPGILMSQQGNINQSRPLEDLNSSMKTPGAFSTQPGKINETMINNIFTKSTFPSQGEYFTTRGLVQSALGCSDNSCQPRAFQELSGIFDRNIPTWGRAEAAPGVPGNPCRPGGFLELLQSKDIDNSIYSSLAQDNNSQVMAANDDMQMQANNLIMNPPRPPSLSPEALACNAPTCYEKAALNSDSLVTAGRLLWDDQMPNLSLQL